MLNKINQNHVYAVLGVLGLFGLGYVIKSSSKLNLSNVFGGETREQEDKEEVNEISNEVQELESEGVTATYTDREYKSGASKLERAMKGIGNDAQEVADVFFGIKNEVDLRKLQVAFGVREGQNLSTWLENEMVGLLGWSSSSMFWVTRPDGSKKWISDNLSMSSLANDILKENNINGSV